MFKISKNDILKAAAILKKGGVVAIPTETAYGLAADAMDGEAVRRIFAIKGRSAKKPVPVIAGSLKMAKDFFYLGKIEEKMAREFWPGPLTMLLKPKKKFPAVLARGRKKIAVRVSSSKIVAELFKKIRTPITSTSANLSGRAECYTPSCVRREFFKKTEKPDMILDGGILPRRKPSTIVEICNGKIMVLRQGQIKLKANG